MSMTVESIPKGNVLHVHAEGVFTIESAMRTFLEVIDAIGEHKSEKILFDARDLMGEPTIIERFYYGEFVAGAVTAPDQNRGAVKVPQFAYVLLPPILDPSRLGETVALNRGMKVKAFDNMPDALEWLQVGPVEMEHLVRNG